MRMVSSAAARRMNGMPNGASARPEMADNAARRGSVVDFGRMAFPQGFSVMDRLLFGTRSIGRASSGLPPRTPTKRLRLLELRQGQWPLEPVNGFVLRGGPTRMFRGRGRPSPENE